VGIKKFINSGNKDIGERHQDEMHGSGYEYWSGGNYWGQIKHG